MCLEQVTCPLWASVTSSVPGGNKCPLVTSRGSCGGSQPAVLTSWLQDGGDRKAGNVPQRVVPGHHSEVAGTSASSSGDPEARLGEGRGGGRRWHPGKSPRQQALSMLPAGGVFKPRSGTIARRAQDSRAAPGGPPWPPGGHLLSSTLQQRVPRAPPTHTQNRPTGREGAGEGGFHGNPGFLIPST